MRRFVPLMLLLVAAPGAKAQEAVVIRPEVNVLSGPSFKDGVYYTTHVLKQNEKVWVVGDKPVNGFWGILPPAGSFDLVPKSHIKQETDQLGVCTSDKTLAIVGSDFAHTREKNTFHTTLHKHQQVKIIGAEGANYKIAPPENEFRFIPVEAVEFVDPNRRPKLTPPGGNGNDPGAGSLPMDPLTAQRVELAEQTYRRAEANGQLNDWSQAKKLYEELANSDNSEVRLTALNRLEFIRLRTQGGQGSYAGAPNNYQAGRFNTGGVSPTAYTPQNPAPRTGSGYTYAQDGAPTRNAGNQFSNTDSAQANHQPQNPPPPNNPNAAHETGLLRKAHSTHQGTHLYYLEDHQGHVRCWVTVKETFTLDPYVNKNLTINGTGPLTYSADLKGYTLTAASVSLVSK